MTMSQAITICLRHKYITFSGRASRPEFWKFILFMLLGMIICLIVNSLIFGPELSYEVNLDENGNPVGEPTQRIQYTSGIFGNLFGLATLLPWLAVTWRRMHDSGRRGWLPFAPMLFWIILISGVIVSQLGWSETTTQVSQTGGATASISPSVVVVLILFFLGSLVLNTYWLSRPSDPGSNKYGPNPHEVTP